MSHDRPKIGVSACFFHPDPGRSAFAKKTLVYMERSMGHWLMAGGALPVMVPAPDGDTARADRRGMRVAVDDYAHWLDGLVLHGGADVWPGSYGEQPIDPRWHGDRVRDEYEQALVHAFVRAGKPVFGVCRGLQLINVAFGGTLWQDLPTQQPSPITHRDADVYDENFHTVDIVPGSRLEALVDCAGSYKINSIHHQAVKDLAPGFVVEARCPDDGTIEAIRREGDAYVAAVQWHPEFHHERLGTLDDSGVLHDFLDAALRSRRA
jgi:putative glutamine amidotransferase